MATRWTDDEVEQLHALTDEGWSAADIAKLLGRSVAMVYKKRSEYGLTHPTTCSHCREPMPDELITEGKRGRPNQYCSPSCQADNDWAYRYNRTMDERPKTCEYCGTELDLDHKVVRYCGRYCSNRAWHEKVQADPKLRAIRKARQKKARRAMEKRKREESAA